MDKTVHGGAGRDFFQVSETDSKPTVKATGLTSNHGGHRFINDHGECWENMRADCRDAVEQAWPVSEIVCDICKM